jgi:hypothetical protein
VDLTCEMRDGTSSKVAYSIRETVMISFRDVIAGILIGALMEPWSAIFILCIVWAFASWLFISMAARKREYKSVVRLPLGSVALSRFLVWWTTAFAVSLLFATLTVFVRRLLPLP